MSFQVLSAPAFWLGALGLAGALFALQRLRVRHREVVVPTLLFWREAAEEARARVLVERFRHPLAYLLVLAIAGLIWLALAGPRASADADGVRTTILIDSSARMAREGRLDAVSDAAAELVLRIPSDRRRVVVCGADIRTVLAPGESPHLLAARLEQLTSTPAPPSLETALHSLAGEAGQQDLFVLSDAPVSEETRALIEELGQGEVRLYQPALSDKPLPAANNAVVALGLAAASSGDPSRVDALVAVVGDSVPVLTVDGAPLPKSMVQELRASDAQSPSDDRRTFIARDVPAEGGTLRAEVAAGDGLPHDDWAARVLPIMGPLRVWLDPALPQPFRLALEVDIGVRLTANMEEAEVLCRVGPGPSSGTAVAGSLPELVLTSRAVQEEPLLILHRPERGSDDVLQELVPLLGLDRVDARALATAAGVPFAIGAAPGEARRLSMWAELLEEDGANLTQSRAFPALVSRGVRWLAGRAEVQAELAAGREHGARAVSNGSLPSSAGSTLTGPSGERLQELEGVFVPPSAGEWRDAQGRSLFVALSSAPASATATSANAGLEDDDVASLAGGDLDWIAWLLVLCLALLAAEWVLVRTGRMP